LRYGREGEFVRIAVFGGRGWEGFGANAEQGA
jgi:hypothetical protein